jgi:xylan 1,4-beta-xylosidase
MVHTTDIRGEWSEPVYLNSIGFDPSLFHDTDGKKYLINMVNGFKGVLVQEVSFEYGSTTKKPVCHRIGEQKKVYAGSGIGCTEGPHMYHIGDWYYLIVAEGGTGYSHCVTVARAKSVFGPFETMPDNPVLTSDRENPKALQKCGHADMVETPDGEWYMVHLCARPVADTNKCTLGRETAIQKLAWTPDGWPTLADGGRYVKGIPEGRAASFEADFTAPSLPPAFVSPRASYQDFADLSSRPGYLRIHAQESMNSWHHVSLLAVHQQEWECCAQTVMECTPQYSQQLAGFTYVYDSMHFYLLAKTTDDDGNCLLTLLKSDAGVITDEMEPVPVPKDKALHLRCLVTENGKTAQFSYSFDGEEWKQAGSSLSTELVTDEHCRGFTGAHFGVYAHDLTGIGFSADFSQFTITY